MLAPPPPDCVATRAALSRINPLYYDRRYPVFVVMERCAHDWWIHSTEDFEREANLDTLQGMYVKATGGGTWCRQIHGNPQPYMWNAFGGHPDTPLTALPNDTDAIQCALNVIGCRGGTLEFPGNRVFAIYKTLYLRITRQQRDPPALAADANIADRSNFRIFSDGTGHLVALAPMEAMLMFQYNSNAVGGVTNFIGPEQSTVTGIRFNGNGKAKYAVDHGFTSKTKIYNNVIFNVTQGGVHWVGSAQANVYGNVIKAPQGIVCAQGYGGDLHIGPNDYYFPATGGCAVFIENSGNIVVDGGTVNGEGFANVVGVEIKSVNGLVRHVKVLNMEWSGCLGVRTRGLRSRRGSRPTR